MKVNNFENREVLGIIKLNLKDVNGICPIKIEKVGGKSFLLSHPLITILIASLPFLLSSSALKTTSTWQLISS